MESVTLDAGVVEILKGMIAVSAGLVGIVVTAAGWFGSRIATGIESLDKHVGELGKEMALVNQRQARMQSDLDELSDDVDSLEANYQTVRARLFRVNERAPGDVIRVRKPSA